ncbi:MAG TPA: DUF72 domain-containing protein [Tahibacter sp.]|uniref:DUF72 domain-containing protein n=1 Tax=Tahibacter sp. TaxID=2056211 RepID=UPI002BCFDC97|nr:DUF72 domain-containing protein [Tahibacter sp.]HSX59508.1 DUF72 domain-containing protein [Tahibacter sp.]
MKIYVGTASWTDKSLVASGRFYPKGCSSAEARLRYYAMRFPIVEVDSSYYALPSVRNAALWVERTPPAFVFNVKAFRLLTLHQAPVAAMPPDLLGELGAVSAERLHLRDLPPAIVDEIWSRFLDALQPLVRAGKLGALHFQFPSWFVAQRDSYDYLLSVRERLAGCTVALEFRHRSWMDAAQRPALLQFERDHRFVNATVDEPQSGANTIPTVWEATHPQLALLRLHGRNEAAWNVKSAESSQRFNYDYTEEQLEGFVPRLRALAADVASVHVIFNNNYEDQGPRNAATLMRLLGGAAVAAV